MQLGKWSATSSLGASSLAILHICPMRSPTAEGYLMCLVTSSHTVRNVRCKVFVYKRQDVAVMVSCHRKWIHLSKKKKWPISVEHNNNLHCRWQDARRRTLVTDHKSVACDPEPDVADNSDSLHEGCKQLSCGKRSGAVMNVCKQSEKTRLFTAALWDAISNITTAACHVNAKLIIAPECRI